MKGNNKIIIVALLLTMISMFGGCQRDDEYNSFVINFDKLYYSVAKNIDIEHTYDSITRLQTDENKKSIDEMGELIRKIKDKVPKGKMEYYEQLCKQYDGIVFLQNTFIKWDNLTKDAKRRINTEIWWAYSLNQDNKSK